MSDLPLRNELFQAGRRALVTTPNQRINPVVVDVPGSDANLIVGASSLMGEEVIAVIANCFQGLFVDTAIGPQLDRVAFDRYGLTRFSAIPATVDLVLSRPAPGAAGIYPQGGVVQTPGGTRFATDSEAVFAPADLSKTVSATALVTGPEGNVSDNTVTAFSDAPFDVTMSVTNPSGAAGGSDVETDAQFRGRIRDFFPTVRRGTMGAIEFGARQVPGIRVAKGYEIDNICSEGGADVFLPACEVDLVVADVNGRASSSLLEQVRRILIDFRAAGIPVRVRGGTVVNTTVRWFLTFTLGFDTQRGRDQLRAVTVASAQALRPGETLYRSTLIAAARQVPGAIITDASLADPLVDIVPATNDQIIRVRPQDVSFA